MRKEILIAGSGGQGIQLVGGILKRALHSKGYIVAKDESYTPAVRGGVSSSEVVIDYGDWPQVLEADLFAVLHQEGYQDLKEKGKLKKETQILYDPALVQPESGNLYPVSISETASRIKGSLNMVLLGAILALLDLISLEDVYQALKEEDKFSEANRRALEEGYKLTITRFPPTPPLLDTHGF